MRMLEWALIKYDLCSFKKRKLRHGSHRPRKEHKRTQMKGSYRQSNKRGLRGTHTNRHLDFGLVAFRTVRK